MRRGGGEEAVEDRRSKVDGKKLVCETARAAAAEVIGTRFF
jgi:hypothetical protein